MFTNQNKLKNHLYFMRLALNQAQISLGNTKVNPSVGCVITKNNNIISVGRTGLNGRPHAEHNAITASRTKLLNSNMYVTLEPCAHYGKTPPCTNNIIKNKIKRVFFSVDDPDLRTFKKSHKILTNKNIHVSSGLMKNEIKDFYRSYYKSKNFSLPFVTSKIAISKDFFLTNKKKRWITNKYSRGRVHMLRAQNDCIITSSKTVNTDDSELSCRIRGLEKKSPKIAILDKNLKININSKIIKKSSKNKCVIFYNKDNYKKINLLKKKRIMLYKVKLNYSGGLKLNEVLLKLKKKGYSRIFIEAGLKLNESFIKENLIDDFIIFVSNKKIYKYGKNNFKKYLFSSIFKNKKMTEKVNLMGEKLLKYKLK